MFSFQCHWTHPVKGDKVNKRIPDYGCVYTERDWVMVSMIRIQELPNSGPVRTKATSNRALC